MRPEGVGSLETVQKTCLIQLHAEPGHEPYKQIHVVVFGVHGKAERSFHNQSAACAATSSGIASLGVEGGAANSMCSPSTSVG
jgi:hypothetical protein